MCKKEYIFAQIRQTNIILTLMTVCSISMMCGAVAELEINGGGDQAHKNLDRHI